METTEIKVKAVKVTAKDWDRMRGVIARSNSSASKTIKDKDMRRERDRGQSD